jgi:alkylhydroperoxidase family enzyme
MRNARMVDCGACQNVRLDAPRNDGLREDIVSDITDDYEGSDLLTAQDKAALQLTDAIVGDPTLLSETAKAVIHEHFTDEQIAELAFEIAKLGAVAKLIITMGMEPETPPNAMVVPTPGKEHGLLSQEALQGAM